ncbi:FecR protein [Posidoniimonas polymericola]|uniref:FecR protein n=1 Tax=Posidoniimonas polymericola TaxID=2528002 RepID=A0A5C5XTN8_9BACT|nr:LamG-like jellyroll fold domain-containing protein [Posidoniimonas polymericola]TWT66244.1 FecR protein [Posidoniimonas polymericola]
MSTVKRDDDPERQLDLLLAEMVDGQPDPDRHQKIAALVADDKYLRQRYVDFCQFQAILLAEHGVLHASIDDRRVELSNSQDRAAPSAGLRFPTMVTLAALALAVCVLVTVAPFTLPDPGEEPIDPSRGSEVARVHRSIDAQFVFGLDASGKVAAGDRLREGPYDLVAGILELQYDSGASLVVQAPALFDLVDASTLRLHGGKVAAHIPEEAIGFVVETSGGRVVDLGTDFAVESRAGDDTEIHVFNGEVRVEPRGLVGLEPNVAMLTLYGGGATRIDDASGTPAGIDLDSNKFLRPNSFATDQYPAAVMGYAPVLYYRMEPGEDPRRLVDSSASGIDAEIASSSVGPGLWAPGRVGIGIDMSRSDLDSYIAAQYPRSTTGKLTAMAWVRARSRPYWGSIAKNWGSQIRGQLHFGLCGFTGELAAHITDAAGEEIEVVDRVPLPLNQWHHVAFVADGQVLRLYRNGEEVASTPCEGLGSSPSLNKLAIGDKLVDGEEYAETYGKWDGVLDELAVFHRALSEVDIRQLYLLGSNE